MKTLILSLTLALSSSVFAKRMAPKPVKYVIQAGLRYEVPHWSSDIPGAKHNGGYIRVVNTKNNLMICTKEVYDVKYNSNLEYDIQDNFIRRISVEGTNLVIESEKLAPIKKPIEGFCN